jgi:hypothetical protein
MRLDIKGDSTFLEQLFRTKILRMMFARKIIIAQTTTKTAKYNVQT